MRTTLLTLLLFASTVASNAARLVDVMSFGADPTGVADSTVAFQQAANTTNVLTIPVPSGRYKISSTVSITVPGKHFIGTSDGDGLQSIVQASTTNVVLFEVLTSGVNFTGITFSGETFHPDGTGSCWGVDMDATDLDTQFTSCTFRDLRVAAYSKGRNVTYSDCLFLSLWDGPIFDTFPAAGDMRGYIIQNSRFHGIRDIAIWYKAGANLFHSQVQGNVFDGLNIASIVVGEVNSLKFTDNKVFRILGNGITVTNNLAGDGTVGDFGNYISDNVFEYLEFVPWGDCMHLSGPNWNVLNNKIQGSPNNVFRISFGTNSVVAGNHFRNSGTHGMILTSCDNISVRGNTISNWGKNQVAGTHYNGIYVEPGNNVQIIGNRLTASTTNALSDGIVVLGNDALIEGNYIVDPYIGIFMNASSTNSSIVANTVIRAQAAGLSDNSQGVRRHHAMTYTDCVLDVFGAGSAYEENLTILSGGVITNRNFNLQTSGVFTSSGTATTLERVARWTKTGAGGNEGIEFWVGTNQVRVYHVPSPGLSPVEALYTVWNGGTAVDVLTLRTNGSALIPELEVTGTITANQLVAALLELTTLNTGSLNITNAPNFLTTNAVPGDTNAAKWVKIQVEGVDYAIPASILP